MWKFRQIFFLANKPMRWLVGIKSAVPESFKHIYTNNSSSTLYYNKKKKKHSHKNITFEIIISTSVSDKVLLRQCTKLHSVELRSC